MLYALPLTQLSPPAPLVEGRVLCRNGRPEDCELLTDWRAEYSTETLGEIETETSGESLEAKTSNGEIDARFSGHKVNLQTNNGRIAADLSE